MARETDEQRRDEARRILERAAGSGGSLFDGASSALGRHVTAKDGEAEDRVELWGQRVGRTIALGVTLAVIVCLLLFFFRS